MKAPKTLTEEIEQEAERAATEMVTQYDAITHAQGDRPAWTRARTMYEKSASLLPDWLSHAPAFTQDGEAWRQQFIADFGPAKLLEHDAEMRKLYADSRTSLDATLHLTEEQAGHYFAARDAGAYQHAADLEQGGQSAD